MFRLFDNQLLIFESMLSDWCSGLWIRYQGTGPRQIWSSRWNNKKNTHKHTKEPNQTAETTKTHKEVMLSNTVFETHQTKNTTSCPIKPKHTSIKSLINQLTIFSLTHMFMNCLSFNAFEFYLKIAILTYTNVILIVSYPLRPNHANQVYFEN